MQPNETDNILQFPTTTMGIRQENGPKRKWLLVFTVTLVVLLVMALITVAIHYTHNKEPHETTTFKEASTPKTKTENWQPFEQDLYLVLHRKGTNCDRAKEYCAKRNATLAVLDQNNVHWLKKISKGKKLWLLKEVLEGSGSEDSETTETGDLTCTLLRSDTTSGLGDGCICMKGG